MSSRYIIVVETSYGTSYHRFDSRPEYIDALRSVKELSERIGVVYSVISCATEGSAKWT